MNGTTTLIPASVPTTPPDAELLRVILRIEPTLCELYTLPELEQRVRLQLHRLRVAAHITRHMD